mgnify:CR=1 FL=1
MKRVFDLVLATVAGSILLLPIILIKLTSKGVVSYLGYCSDVAKLFSQANIIVLPSYREGGAKVLVETAACGRAVITTDVPRCR